MTGDVDQVKEKSKREENIERNKTYRYSWFIHARLDILGRFLAANSWEGKGREGKGRGGGLVVCIRCR